MEKTLEEILLEQLELPVRLKNGSVAENPRTGEPLMPEEAICMSIVQKAMKDIWRKTCHQCAWCWKFTQSRHRGSDPYYA